MYYRFQAFLGLVAFVMAISGAIFARSLFTPRAWWFLITTLIAFSVGVFTRYLPLTLLGLTLLFWFIWEWLIFSLRIRTTLRRVRVERAVLDAHGPVRMLWAGQTFTVQIRVSIPERGWAWLRYVGLQPSLPHIAVTDPVPFGVERTDCEPGARPRIDGPLRISDTMILAYTIRCGTVGSARFEGVRVQLADLQGFFYHSTFLRAPQILRILPRVVDHDAHSNNNKRHNQLPPPGMHRLRQPGSGSELLDLRDYLPGDPPRTIAWKVSARRDRLITKEFESEVPIRCTLFVDTSGSVRLPTRRGTPLQRLVEIAAAVLRSNSDRRDLTGLCLFDEQTATSIRPDRSSSHVTRLLNLLTDAASLAPVTRQADPERLLPLAYGFAEEVYPDLLRPERNAMPFWLYWLGAFPGNWRRRVGLLRYLHRRKLDFFWMALTLIPFNLLLINILVGFLIQPYERAALTVVSSLVSFLILLLAITVLVLTLFLSGRQRRLASQRKRLAALLSVRYGMGPGGLEAMLEDEDLLVLQMQHFLSDHRVPYNLPLYDREGRYLFAAPEKVPVLGRALIEAVGRGRDNELFVLLADVLELDEHLEPLVQAMRVALGRHHQVILISPWPAGLDLPGKETTAARPPRRAPVPDIRARTERLLSQVTQESYLAAYHRVHRRLSGLGVTMICAAGNEAVPLILQRMDRLRGVRRRV
jgi:uncharacterized protein (DUF58 family)